MSTVAPPKIAHYVEVTERRQEPCFVLLAADQPKGYIVGWRVDQRGQQLASYRVERKKVRKVCRALMHESHGLIPVGG